MKEELKKLMQERGNRLAKAKQEISKKAPYISTGSTLLDLSLGGGDAIDKGGMGEKVGNILNVAGDSASGKSFLVCEIIANARKDVLSGKLAEHGITKFKWVYNDVESGYNFDSKALWGFEIQSEDKSKRFSTRTIERCSSHIQTELNSLKEDELLVYVVDSWDALSSEANVKRNDERLAKHKKNEKYEKGSMGMDKQKFIGQEFFNPIQTLMLEKNAIIILVSQIRDNVGAAPFEKKWRIGAEAVMKFYADTRILIKTATKNDVEITVPETGEIVSRWMGSSVISTPLKTRHSRPCRAVQYEFLFTYGLDDVPSCIDFLYNLREEKTKRLRTGDAVKNLTFPPKPPGIVYTARTVPNLRAWVKEQVPEGGVKSTTTKDVLMDIIHSNDLVELFEAEFGSGLDREGLIQYIFNNDLEEELKKAVITRWEFIESTAEKAVKGRKSKW
jgi:RecA/RadA recombinase